MLTLTYTFLYQKGFLCNIKDVSIVLSFYQLGFES